MNKLYAAPMEGLTGYLWRQVHAALFGPADKYFTPFLSPNATRTFQRKELDEIDPDGTLGITPKKAARLISESLVTLRQIGVTACLRRSNGKRIIELHRAESVDTPGVDPIDPCEATGDDLSAVSASAG